MFRLRGLGLSGVLRPTLLLGLGLLGFRLQGFGLSGFMLLSFGLLGFRLLGLGLLGFTVIRGQGPDF